MMASLLLPLIVAASITSLSIAQPAPEAQCTVTKALGCYLEASPPGRVLVHEVARLDADMSKEHCAGLVAGLIGISGASSVDMGVEYGNQCFYGSLASSVKREPDGDCTMACTGNASQTCGGKFRIEVFQANCRPPIPQPPYPPGPLPTEGPCDILAAAGNPCVAAHSTIRALYSAYTGPLYNVTRTVTNSSAPEWRSIPVLKAGGFANASVQDEFCANTTTCVISNVYDQSPMGNHLGQRHMLVDAMAHRLTVGPQRLPVYGMWFEPGYGYHVDKTTGIATGNDPESMYAVMSGTHFNGRCCFDYGNSETDDTSDGCGTMEAISFGNAHWKGREVGDGRVCA
jgi:hypothetical protein